MFSTTAEAEGEVVRPLNRLKTPSNLNFSKAVLLVWFSMLLALVSVSVLFSLSMCLVRFFRWGWVVNVSLERAAQSVNCIVFICRFSCFSIIVSSARLWF